VQRAALVVGLVALGAGAAGAGAPELKRVEGTATTEHSICKGGVAVTQRDYDELPPPVPIAGREFLVVAGAEISAKPPAARFVTRADGSFSTRLPPGQWCFFEAGRRPAAGRVKQPVAAPPRPHVDADCLEQQRLRCDLVLAVKSDVKRARITFQERCPQPWAQPCYHGPMPP
jgi:hypothetical protein